MKKTDFKKVIGRKDYRVKQMINRLPTAPFKEQVIVYDFTGKG